MRNALILALVAMGIATSYIQGKLVLQNGHTAPITSIAIDRGFIVSASRDRTLIRQNDDGRIEERFIGHTGVVTGVAYVERGRRVLSVSRDGTIRFWKNDGTVERVITNGLPIHAFASAEESDYFVTADSEKVMLRHKDGTKLRSFGGISNDVTALALSEQGAYLAAGITRAYVTNGKTNYEGSVRLYDVTTAKYLRTLPSPKESVAALAFTKKGTFLASTGAEESLEGTNGTNKGLTIIADVATGQTREVFTHSGEGTAIAFHPDDTIFILASYTYETYKNVLSLRRYRDDEVDRATNATNDNTATNATNDNTATNATTNAHARERIPLFPAKRDYHGRDERLVLTMEGHLDIIRAIRFRDNARFLTASDDTMLMLWNTNGTRERAFHRGYSRPMRSVALAGKGDVIAGGDAKGAIYLWEAKSRTNTRVIRLREHGWGISSLAFRYDGKRLLAGSLDGTLSLWDVDWDYATTYSTATNTRRVTTNETNTITNVVTVITERVKRKSAVMKTETAIVTTINTTYTNGASVGETNATTNSVTNHARITMTHSEETNAVTSVAYSTNGYIVSAAWDKTVRVWTEDGALYAVFPKDEALLNAVAITKDGAYVASGSGSITFAGTGTDRYYALAGIKLYTRNGKLLHTFHGQANALAFLPQSPALLSGRYGKALLWNTNGSAYQTYQHVFEREVLIAPDGRAVRASFTDIHSVAVSEQEAYYAAGYEDGVIKVWHGNGVFLRALEGHHHRVTALAFLANERILASASEDGTLSLWDVRTGKRLRLIAFENGLYFIIDDDGNYECPEGGEAYIEGFGTRKREGLLYEFLYENEQGA